MREARVNLEVVGGDPGLAGRAYWNQRSWLQEHANRVQQLATVVGDSTSLNLPQWAQLMAVVREFEPDLIIELGRARGNSTVAFAEVAATSDHPLKIVSYCRSLEWRGTRQRLASLVSEDWFTSLDIRWGDIAQADFEAARTAGRVIVLWDAHGFEIAEAVLARLLPLLEGRPHIVLVHDISDTRYDSTDRGAYDGSSIWRGDLTRNEKFRIGHVESGVPQAVSILDFCTRNSIPLHSADASIAQEIVDPGRSSEMASALGPLWGERGHWSWFTLTEAGRTPVSFPAVGAAQRRSLVGRVKQAVRILLGWTG